VPVILQEYYLYHYPTASYTKLQLLCLSTQANNSSAVAEMVAQSCAALGVLNNGVALCIV